MAKLADAPALGSGGEILRRSSPLPGTPITQRTLNAQLSTLNVQFRQRQLDYYRLVDGSCRVCETDPSEDLVRGKFANHPFTLRINRFWCARGNALAELAMMKAATVGAYALALRISISFAPIALLIC